MLVRLVLATAVLSLAGIISISLSSSLGSGAALAGENALQDPQPPTSWAATAPLSSSEGLADRVRSAMGNVPLGFEPNQGQAEERVKFLARGNGYALFLTADEAVLRLAHSRARNGESIETAVSMRVAGANRSAAVVGAEELAAKSNYFIGNDSGQWRTNVPQFAQVRYQEIYPGIDLIYYGSQGNLEYDFEIAPGADPNAVRLHFEGMERLRLDPTGDLIMHTARGSVRLRAPSVYQQIGREKREVAARFVLASDRDVRFALGTYDRSRMLVIDPQLTYSTFLGGSSDEDCVNVAVNATNTIDNCQQVAVDSAFNFYVAGSTTSNNFPPQPGVHGTLRGARNIFVSKFNPGGALISSTYLGGNGVDSSAGLAVDSVGNIFIAGTTTSTNFPTVGGISNPGLNASAAHVFVSELKANFSGLTWGTLLGGDSVDAATGMAIDNKGNVYVSGITASPHFHTTSGSLQPNTKSATDSQFFVAKFTPSKGANSLAYSTYFGGGNPASGAITQGGGIAVDSNQNVYITGGTNFLRVGAGSDFRILNAAQPCLDTPGSSSGGCSGAVAASDAFVAKINPAAAANAALVYSTYLGGTGNDFGNAIAVDSGGNVYITGKTDSTDWIKPATPLQANNGGGTSDAFVAKLNNPAANAAVGFTYFTYLGGSGDDVGQAIAVDSFQGARLAGKTTGSFPSINASGFQTGAGGAGDAFVARVDTTSAVSSGNFVSFFGGSAADAASGVALDSNFSTYLAGSTASSDFPLSGTPAQNSLSGPTDAFVGKIGSLSDLQLTGVAGTSASPTTTIGVGNSVTFTFTVKNVGPDPTAGVVFTNSLPGTGVTFNSISSSPGSCASPVTGTVQCSIGTMQPGASATVTVVLTPTMPFAGGFSDSATVTAAAGSVDPNLGNNSAQAGPVTVTDFSISASPNTFTVPAPAGTSATYQITATPIPNFPNSVSLSCSAGLPSGTACAFSTNPLAFSSSNNSSPLTSTLTITTTARPVTTAGTSRVPSLWYALVLPFSGILVAFGWGKNANRKRRMGIVASALVLSGVIFQAACGGDKSTTPPTTGGTPAGTYTITVTGTSGAAGVSGTAPHAANVTLVVQ